MQIMADEKVSESRNIGDMTVRQDLESDNFSEEIEREESQVMTAGKGTTAKLNKALDSALKDKYGSGSGSGSDDGEAESVEDEQSEDDVELEIEAVDDDFEVSGEATRDAALVDYAETTANFDREEEEEEDEDADEDADRDGDENEDEAEDDDEEAGDKSVEQLR